mgnify:CR=1 FL=1
MKYHLYADDTQIYLSFDANDSDEAVKQLELCVKEIRSWMARNFSFLNNGKTELIVFGKKSTLRSKM